MSAPNVSFQGQRLEFQGRIEHHTGVRYLLYFGAGGRLFVLGCNHRLVALVAGEIEEFVPLTRYPRDPIWRHWREPAGVTS